MFDPDHHLAIARPDCPLQAAVELYGSSRALAAAIGRTPQAVTNWRARGYVPASAALAIERATHGQVRAASFRTEPPRETADE